MASRGWIIERYEAYMENEWGFDQELIACLSTPADAHLKDKSNLFLKKKKVERPKLDPIPLHRVLYVTDAKSRAAKIKLANQDSSEGDHFAKWKCKFCDAKKQGTLHYVTESLHKLELFVHKSLHPPLVLPSTG